MKRSESYDDFCEADDALMEFRKVRRTIGWLTHEYEAPEELYDDFIKLEGKLTEFANKLYLGKVKRR